MLKMSRLFLALTPLALAACSDAPSAPKEAAPPPPRGIFISANDCAAAGKLTGDECGGAIDAAIAAHESKTKGYKTLKQCDAAEGKDRCTKTVDGQFRPRLQAFLIVMAKPVKAEPLYPPKKGKTLGFRSPTLPAVDASDESLIVSSAALTIAHENSRLP